MCHYRVAGNLKRNLDYQLRGNDKKSINIMRDDTVKMAVSAFQAARVGHNRWRKLEATKGLVRAAADFLSAGSGGTNDEKKRLKALAMILTG